MKLYDFELSGNCYKVRLLLSLLQLDWEGHPVDLQGGEHKRAPFLALNPRGQVPVLADGEVVVADSQAILVYLARKSGRSDVYPEHPEGQARIQFWLSIAANEVARGPADARLVKLFGADLDLDRARDKASLVLQLIEDALAGGPFLVGDRWTLADIAVFPYVALAGDGDISLTPYPRIRAWIDRIKALDGFVTMPGIA